MSLLVPIMMFGWVPAVLTLFACIPARRAVLMSFLFAWLFLPMVGYSIPGLPDYTKMTATCLGVTLGAAIFDGKRVAAFRLVWFDLPIAVWCLCPFMSSVTMGLGIYDGCSAVMYQTITWGLPYFIGRVYFADGQGLRELAVGLFWAGLVYVPFCLYEMKMSPCLHMNVYGIAQWDWAEAKRFGGWRPKVFMQHGLMTGMWMCMTALIGIWLWRTRVVRRVGRLPMAWAAGGLVGTAVLCKSFGAVVLLAGGSAALLVAKWSRSSIPVWCLVVAAPLYIAARGSGAWTGDALVSLSREVGNEERAQSLQVRLKSEELFLSAAWQRPLFGWRNWLRSSELWEEEGFAIPDALWMIALIQNGLVGLLSLTGMLLVPPALALMRLRGHDPAGQMAAPAIALAAVLCLYMIDSLYNAMVNPVFMLAAGGVVSWAQYFKRAAVQSPACLRASRRLVIPGL